MEWQPVNAQGQNVKVGSTDIDHYNWGGYNPDGSAKAGTVPSATVDNGRVTIHYTSNASTRSGTASFMSKNSKYYRRLQVNGIPTTTMGVNVNVNYRQVIKKGLINDKIVTDVSIDIWNENGQEHIYDNRFNDNMGISSKVYDNPNKFYNSVKYAMGLSNYLHSDAITAVYPESIFVGGGVGLGIRCMRLFRVAKGAVKTGFKVEGQLAQIFGNNKLFSNWLKGNHSLSRVGNPLNATEAQQIINNAKKLGMPIESNIKGLQGLEKTGQWGEIPHFKVGNVHIPIEKGLDGVLKF